MQHKQRHTIFTRAKQMFTSGPRYKTPIPAPYNGQWWYSAGPVFYPGINGVILQSRLSKPWQSLFGYAYRVALPEKFGILQPASLYAPKGVPIVGINIQQGSMGVITPAVNSDGTYVDEDEASYAQF